MVEEMTSVAGPRLACGLACKCGEHRVFLIPFAYKMIKKETLTINAIHITQRTVVFLYYHHRECVQLLVFGSRTCLVHTIQCAQYEPSVEGAGVEPSVEEWMLSPRLRGGN